MCFVWVGWGEGVGVGVGMCERACVCICVCAPVWVGGCLGVGVESQRSDRDSHMPGLIGGRLISLLDGMVTIEAMPKPTSVQKLLHEPAGLIMASGIANEARKFKRQVLNLLENHGMLGRPSGVWM